MREARAIMGELAASGLVPEHMALLMELMTAVAVEARPTIDAQAERRRANDRDRKRARNPRISAETAETKSDAPPNDIYSNPPEPSEAKASEPPFSERVVSAWNDGPAKRGATKAQKMDAGRRKLLATRVREHGEDGVLAAIRGIELSDFHCGIGEKSFRSNLGWLLKSPEPFAAAIDRAASATPTTASQPVADTGAYLASIADKPWMRGRENELALPRSAGPPRSIGQLAAGIAGTMSQPH